MDALPPLMKANEKRGGFTLIELSIVLVIIGLIVGGVLTGRDLIAAANIRATLKQFEQYNAAVHTFRTKNGGIPGDLRASLASQVGLPARPGTASCGDGDGLIETNSMASNNLRSIIGEFYAFWEDLSLSNLITLPASATSGFGWSLGNCNGNLQIIGDSQTSVLPSAALGGRTMWVAYSDLRANYFLLTGRTLSAGTPVVMVNAITPQQAYALDSKADDGLPQTGRTVAVTSTSGMNGLATPLPPAAGVCVSNVGNSPYNTAGGYESTPACQVRFGFN